jgi:V8-like Glu-specific endopeptidase
MKVLAFGTAALTAVVLAAGCSSGDGASSQQVQPVQGGQVDTTHDFAVGVCVGNGPGQCQLLCSGALIAPNLVMTARHCVDQSPQQIDCTSASTVFGSQYAGASAFWITTHYQMFQSSLGWHQAKQIFTTPGTKVCGNDMALIELANNVSQTEAGGSFVTPVVQYSMTDHSRYSTTVTAIGYGDTSATTQDAGTRHILESINLVCIPGDSLIDCGQQSQISANEFVSGDSTCEGDSGSSAYEQKSFNKNVPVSFGVLSRGGSSGSTCVEPIYTRTDAWKDFIVQTAMTAASDGNYTAPSWTSSAPPPPTDGGTTDSGTTQPDGGPAPAPGSLGAPCGDATDCTSGQCLSNDGGSSYICSAPCDPSGDGSDCGAAGYACQSDGQGNGWCFPAPPSTSSGSGGGCAVGTSDPSKPVPWGTLTLAGAYLAVAAIRSRRRRE